MKKSLLLLICVLPAFTAASSHHTLSYKLDDIDLDCMEKAGLRLDLQGGCFHNAIDRMEQKIIKSGKMNRKQLTRYLNPYKERCIKEAIMARNVDPHDFAEYGTADVYGCLLDDVYTLYHKLGFKHKPASPAKWYEYNHPKY